MKEASQVIELPLMGMKEGLTRGVAKDFVIDSKTKRIKSILLKLEKNYDYRELMTGDVIGIGKDYILSRSLDNAKQVDLTGIEMTMLGMKCVASSGDILGSIRNFVFEEKTGEIESLILDNGSEIEGKSIISLSNALMFIDSEGNFVQKETVSSFESEQREYMLGRTVSEDIVDKNGTVLVAKGETVDEKIIQKADDAGISTELMLNLE